MGENKNKYHDGFASDVWNTIFHGGGCHRDGGAHMCLCMHSVIFSIFVSLDFFKVICRENFENEKAQMVPQLFCYLNYTLKIVDVQIQQEMTVAFLQEFYQVIRLDECASRSISNNTTIVLYSLLRLELDVCAL